MLMKYGRLSKDQAIGGAMQTMGMWAMFASVLLSAWVMRLMAAGATEGETAEAISPSS